MMTNETTNEELLQALKDYYNTYNKIPSQNTFPKRTMYSRRFGSWNNALRQAGLPTRPDGHKNGGGNKRQIISCIQCGEQTKNPQFCSRSCSTSYKNLHSKIYDKKERIRVCKRCGISFVSTKKQESCDECLSEYYNNFQLRLSDLPGYAHRASQFSVVRSRARALYKDKIAEGCEICNYKLHAEVCHIKPIADYPTDTLISDINASENVKILCRNCHWELDHNLLTI